MAPVKNYSPHQMGLAMEAVRKGLNHSEAARKYGVPRCTLRNKAVGRSPTVCAMGPSTILSRDEEDLLIKWLFAMAERHCPVSKEQLLDSIQLIIKHDGRETPFTNGRPGRKWFKGFSNRHPEVAQRIAQNLVTSRENVSEEEILNWFHKIGQYIKENDLEEAIQDPKRVYNADESAFFLNPKPGHVLTNKGNKNVYSASGNEKENLTVLLTANASGQLAPPMIVFSYDRIPKHIAESVPEVWGVGKSETGWMCGSTFYEYIANIFYPWLIENQIQLPVIFFLDGHASHLTKPLSDFCTQNQIELIALYPNSTHLLQPMDLAVFRPLKVFWRQQVKNWKARNSKTAIQKENFAPIFECALQNVTPECIKNGFRAGGLFPFGPDYIDFSKLHQQNRKRTLELASNLTQNSEFLTKLEEEIIKVFTRSKLDIFKKCFYLNRDSVNDMLPIGDLTLYTLWAKYKHLNHSENWDIAREAENEQNNTYDNEKKIIEESIDTEKTRSKNNGMEKGEIKLQNVTENSHYGKKEQKICCVKTKTDTECMKEEHKKRQNVTETGSNEIKRQDTDSENTNGNIQESKKGKGDIQNVTENETNAILDQTNKFKHSKRKLDDTKEENIQIRQVIEDITPKKIENIYISKSHQHKTPSKTSFANYMSQSDIVVPSPFKKALFWPELVSKKGSRQSKEKIPSVITSEAWREYHEKKETAKKIKEEEVKQRKEERLRKKEENEAKKLAIKNRKRNRKRKRVSVSSSSELDSDITYAESGQSYEEILDLSNEITEIEENSQIFMKPNRLTSHDEKKVMNDKKLSQKADIKILENTTVDILLDERTGILKVQKKTEHPHTSKKEKVKTAKRPNFKTERVYYCLVCSDKYVDPPLEDWIECGDCREWAHEACTSYTGFGSYFCDLCHEL